MSWAAYWGTHWGGSLGVALTPTAWAVSERQTWVTFARAPLAVSTITVGDALNPASWTLSRLDTGAELIVIGVRALSSHTFELYTLYKFAGFPVMHQVNASVLDKLTLAPVALSLQFSGCMFYPAAPPGDQLVDVANPYFTAAGDAPVSHLIVGASGDYANESGDALWQKLIFRRLTTLPSGFFHLDPATYGLGLRVKESVGARQLPALQAEILQHLLREPEFAAASVHLRLRSDGVLAVQIRVKLVLGDIVDFAQAVPDGSVRL